MGEACWIKAELGDLADNSALAGISGMMEQNYPRRIWKGQRQKRDGTGSGGSGSDSLSLSWVYSEHCGMLGATVGTRKQEMGVPMSPHCTHPHWHASLLCHAVVEEGPPQPLI